MDLVLLQEILDQEDSKLKLNIDAAIAGDLERYEKKLYGMDCIQCGSCSFACPAKRPLTPTFKQAKAEITERRKREGGGQK